MVTGIAHRLLAEYFLRLLMVQGLLHSIFESRLLDRVWFSSAEAMPENTNARLPMQNESCQNCFRTQEWTVSVFMRPETSAASVPLIVQSLEEISTFVCTRTYSRNAIWGWRWPPVPRPDYLDRGRLLRDSRSEVSGTVRVNGCQGPGASHLSPSMATRPESGRLFAMGSTTSPSRRRTPGRNRWVRPSRSTRRSRHGAGTLTKERVTLSGI